MTETTSERTRELLAAEKILGRLGVGDAIEAGEVKVRRVSSPFDDGPRFFVFRNEAAATTTDRARAGETHTLADRDPHHTLTEAALAYLAGRRAAGPDRAPAELRDAIRTAIEYATTAGMGPEAIAEILLEASRR